MDWDKFKTSVNTFNNGSWGQVAPAAISTAAPFVTKGNHSVLGDLGMGIGGAVALANPLIGAGIMAASVLGNAAFGANINEGAVQDYQNRLVDYSRPNITAQDNTQLMNQLGTLGSFNINKKDLGTQGWFSHKLDKKYDSLMSDLGAANASRASIVDSAVSNVDKMNDMRIAANYRAFGGPMFEYISDGAIAYDMARDNLMAKLWNAQNKKQADLATSSFAAGGLLSNNFTNGVTKIGAGGTHESNPNEGVPMGIAEDGQPNLVEEGEVLFNDYVFSNRLRVPKAVRNKYRLRGPKNMTYAEAFIEAQKESEERENDPISKNGLDNIAMILAQSQETMRAKNNSRVAAFGGKLFPNGGSMTFEEFFNIYPNATVRDYYDLYPEAIPEPIAKGPDIVGPGVTANKTIGLRKTREPLDVMTSSPMPTILGSAVTNDTIGLVGSRPVTKYDRRKERSGKFKNAVNGIFSEDPAINPLRLADIAANAGAVVSDKMGKTNTATVFDYIPEYSPISFTPIGDYVPELTVDTRYAANQAAQQAAATRGAIMDNINPNRWANLLAADFNAQVANGELLRNAELANYDNMLKARTYNRTTNQLNSEMGLRAQADDAQQRLAYANAKLTEAMRNEENSNAASAARAANIKALTKSIAGVGQELDAIKWRDMLLDAGVFGTVPDKYRVAYGGKLRKKRGGFTY